MSACKTTWLRGILTISGSTFTFFSRPMAAAALDALPIGRRVVIVDKSVTGSLGQSRVTSGYDKEIH